MRNFLHITLLGVIFAALCGVEGCDPALLAQLQQQQADALAKTGQQITTLESPSEPSLVGNDMSGTLTQLENAGLLIPTNPCSALIETTPRGIACLHCTQPSAKNQAAVLAGLLYKSCLKNVAINYLVDGTFSFDAQMLGDHIRLLSSNGRTAFVYFYLTNGATQRRWKSTPINALGTKVSPETFRQAVQTDPTTRAQYQAIIERLLPVLEVAAKHGAQVSLVLGLEDNLTKESYQALYNLTVDTLPPFITAAIGRNPCTGCYSGNDGYIPQGVFEEVHTISAFTDVRDGMITNDGQDYDAGDLNSLANVRNRASSLNSAFIIWSAERQGIPSEGVFPHPSERDYEIPNATEQQEIILFLRGR